MERIKIAPRPGYMGELEKIGFVFHKEYWGWKTHIIVFPPKKLKSSNRP